MMRSLAYLFGFLTVFLAASARGAYLENVPRTIAQPTGEIYRCYVTGDEYYSRLHDAKGYTIIFDSTTGFYVYAIELNGRLVPSAHIVGRSDPEAAGLRAGVVEQMAARSSPETFRLPRTQKVAGSSWAGTMDQIVIFIRFSDETEFTLPLDTCESVFNDSSGNFNSLRNYFWESSYGQFTVRSHFFPRPRGGRIVSYQDSLPRSYYISGGAWPSLIAKAIHGVSNQIPQGLDIDINHDGFVDNVVFVLRGDPHGGFFWPHYFGIFDDSLINGKRISLVSVQVEGYLQTNVLAHELFHCMGAPDLYRYGTYALPVDTWDLMAHSPNPPVHMSAFLKDRVGGWIPAIQELAVPGNYHLNPLTTREQNCYKIRSPYSNSEYFLVEYRRRMGLFESSLPESGMLVYRINSLVSGGNAGGPPDQVYIYRPEGTPTWDGVPSSAAYSARNGRVSINDSTSPSSFLSDGSKGGLDISGVGMDRETISFNFGPTGPLRVTFPNGGEYFKSGDIAPIEWSGPGVGSVTIEYSADNGSTWQLVDSGRVAQSPEGHYDWIVPAPTKLGRIRVSSHGQQSYADWSDDAFAILASDSRLVSALRVRGVEGFASSVHLRGIEETTTVYGAEKVDTLYYLTDYRNSKGKMYRLDSQGTLVDSVQIGGFYEGSGLRDLAWDGANLYGLSARGNILKIETKGMAVIDALTISSLPSNTWGLAYDPVVDGFWLSGFIDSGNSASPDSLRLIDRLGNRITAIPTAGSGITQAMGLAYEGDSLGRGFVWVLNLQGYFQGFYPEPHVHRNVLFKMDLTARTVIDSIVIGEYIDSDHLWAAGAFMTKSPKTGEPVVHAVLAGTTPMIVGFNSNRTSKLHVEPTSTVSPIQFSLFQNYPNPFNPKTGIRYQVPGVREAGAGNQRPGASVKLSVYDLLGREVAVLVNERKTPGSYEVRFDGSGLSSGVYFYRLSAGDFVQTRKMILAK
jgi:M6 family metalloprotease-like protein